MYKTGYKSWDCFRVHVSTDRGKRPSAALKRALVEQEIAARAMLEQGLEDHPDGLIELPPKAKSRAALTEWLKHPEWRGSSPEMPMRINAAERWIESIEAVQRILAQESEPT